MEGVRLKFSETAATLLCRFGFEVEAHENRASKCLSACNGLPDAFTRSEALASRNCMAHTIATISVAIELCPEKLSDN
jgi:hypothetical protein